MSRPVSDPFTVRRAGVADAEAIARVHVASWDAAYADLIPEPSRRQFDVPRRAIQWQRLLDGGARVWVAMEDEVVVGAYAILIMDNIGHLGRPSALVESVAVVPSLQGKGVGQAMMDHAMSIAREKGCYKLTLSSSLKRVRAHAFYEKLGYRRYGYSFGVDLNQGGAP